MTTVRTAFPSGRDHCAAWLTLPEAPGPHPVVVLVHGGGATHAMMLDQYETWLPERRRAPAPGASPPCAEWCAHHPRAGGR
ncbi:hypothetical protein ACFPZ0_01515 [Streptomonospora nanhaiensis]|uniref:Dipeptidyl aminopeptidase/acylaminoacyl peptidase n=1 Tax=Streptomonospora nanhaiensis TaxID=1323731 RepID=A0A853BIA3_9ACTN|nr:hypothetical protein [Streptomonospora nanhaiensis]MBV2366494.1 hypothetical protein [Streptomonospora nanhaiensis]MBX9390013.1 hypothetical protein [Streptomonospora nanhaiensis]NYI94256.1 dipeptidyl aminopeptidase/acylaminoacyl peptidase [Streptomonospora nanhaiensis]